MSKFQKHLAVTLMAFLISITVIVSFVRKQISFSGFIVAQYIDYLILCCALLEI